MNRGCHDSRNESHETIRFHGKQEAVLRAISDEFLISPASRMPVLVGSQRLARIACKREPYIQLIQGGCCRPANTVQGSVLVLKTGEEPRARRG